MFLETINMSNWFLFIYFFFLSVNKKNFIAKREQYTGSVQLKNYTQAIKEIKSKIVVQ
jgi:YbbR domain-containing protein